MKQRGIALVSAVIMMSLTMMLLGAFLQVNRAHLWLLNASEGRQSAHSACQAGFEYVFYRLEHNRRWGEAAFTGRVEGEGTDLQITEVEGTRTVQGYLRPMDATFEVDLENNLNLSAASEFGVPPYMCRLTIRGTAQGATRQVVTLLHQAPLFDSSALTRGQMNMHALQFNVRSKDKWRNQIRAEDNIRIPSATEAKTQFLLPDSTVQDSKGMMWSKGDIFSGGTALNATNIEEANLNAGGRFVPKSRQHFEIFDLQADSIVAPEANTAVRPGVYKFTKATAHLKLKANYGEGWGAEQHQLERDQEIEVLEYYANPDDPLPTHVYRSENKTDDLDPPVPTSVGYWNPKGLKNVDVSDVSITYKGAGTENVPVTIGDKVYLDLDPGSKKVEANLFTQEVKLATGTAVTVDGMLSIESDRGKPPRLNLGAAEQRAAILAKGSINLERAETEGVGTLVSREGDVCLAPLGESFEVETSNPLFGGLVLFAGRDVRLTNPSEEPGGKWDFKGLVYARNNFTFDANQADATVEGTVVARNGSMTFNSDNANVEFIYNPEYLKKMLEDLPANRIQLERIYWRE